MMQGAASRPLLDSTPASRKYQREKGFGHKTRPQACRAEERSAMPYRQGAPNPPGQRPASSGRGAGGRSTGRDGGSEQNPEEGSGLWQSQRSSGAAPGQHSGLPAHLRGRGHKGDIREREDGNGRGGGKQLSKKPSLGPFMVVCWHHPPTASQTQGRQKTPSA